MKKQNVTKHIGIDTLDEICSICDLRYDLGRCHDCIYYGKMCEAAKAQLKDYIDYPFEIYEVLYEYKRQYKELRMERRIRKELEEMGIKDFQKKNNVDWGYNTEGFEYIKPKEVVGKTFNVHGLLITKDSGYGKGALVIVDDSFLSVPPSQVGNIQEMLKDSEVIEQIKKGVVICTVREYTANSGRQGRALDFDLTE